MKHDHTPEPWVTGRGENGWAVYGQGGDLTITNPFLELPIQEADAQRIVACVNACQDIPDPETTIPEMVEALRDVVEASAFVNGNPFWKAVDSARAALAKIEKGAQQG